MENDPVTLIVALDDDFKASGQVYFDDGITHDWQNKNEFILGNLSVTKGQINYRYDISALSSFVSCLASIQPLDPSMPPHGLRRSKFTVSKRSQPC